MPSPSRCIQAPIVQAHADILRRPVFARGAAFLVTAGCAALLLAGAPAHAGFEWSPPPQAAKKAQAAAASATASPVVGPAVAAAPVTPVDIEHSLSGGPDLLPLGGPGYGGEAAGNVAPVDAHPLAAPHAPAPYAPAAPAGGAPASLTPVNPPAPLPSGSQSLAVMSRHPAPPAIPTSAPHADSAYTDAVGFGRDIPLAMVLRQIVPADYSYAFDQGVDPGLTVSWDGGRPWNIVLQDAVRAYGLTAIVSGYNVRITTAGNGADIQTASYNSDAAPQPLAPSSSSPSDAGASASALPSAVPSYPRRVPPPAPQKIAADDFITPLPPGTEGSAAQAHASVVRGPAAGTVSRPPAGGQSSGGETVHFDAPRYQSQPVTASAPSPAFDARAEAPLVAAATPSAPSAAQSVVGESAQTPSSQASQGPMDAFAIYYWQAQKGQSLRATLEDWSAKSGVMLHWIAVADYTLPSAVDMTGTYADVVNQVLASFEKENLRPFGKLYPNLPNGPSVLVVEGDLQGAS